MLHFIGMANELGVQAPFKCPCKRSSTSQNSDERNAVALTSKAAYKVGGQLFRHPNVFVLWLLSWFPPLLSMLCQILASVQSSQSLETWSKTWDSNTTSFQAVLSKELGNCRRFPDQMADGLPALDQKAIRLAWLVAEEVLPQFGVPDVILSDRGTNLLAHVMEDVCQLLDTTKLKATS